jgi:hypothetical protein
MRVLCVLAAALVMLWVQAATAADVIIGQVTGVRGDVFREHAGGREPVRTGAAVRLGETLACYGGKARVQLNDGTIVSIGENSRISFSNYRAVENGFTTQLSVGSGVFRLFVNRLTDGAFTVESETAVAAVRGTDWVMDAQADTTGVAVLSGAVAVSARRTAQGAASGEVVLQPGFGTDVRRGAAPTPPNAWRQERLTATVARASFD